MFLCTLTDCIPASPAVFDRRVPLVVLRQALASDEFSVIEKPV